MLGREIYLGNCMTGQLTSKGFAQQQQNGAMYRRVYSPSGGNAAWLPRSFLTAGPAAAFLRADDYARTIQSAEALASSLFPPNSSSSSTQLLNMHTMDLYALSLSRSWHVACVYIAVRVTRSVCVCCVVVL
jgi:hypothetical protein